MSLRRFDSSGSACCHAAAALVSAQLASTRTPALSESARVKVTEGWGGERGDFARMAAVLTDVVLGCFLSTRSHLRAPFHLLFSIAFPPPSCHTIPLPPNPPSPQVLQKRRGSGRGHEEPTGERTDVTCLLHQVKGVCVWACVAV